MSNPCLPPTQQMLVSKAHHAPDSSWCTCLAPTCVYLVPTVCWKCSKNKVAAHSGRCSQEEGPVGLNVAGPGPNGESARALAPIPAPRVPRKSPGWYQGVDLPPHGVPTPSGSRPDSGPGPRAGSGWAAKAGERLLARGTPSLAARGVHPGPPGPQGGPACRDPKLPTAAAKRCLQAATRGRGRAAVLQAGG